MAEESKIQITLNLNADNASATLRNFKGDIVASKIPLSEVRKEFGNFVLSAKETQRTITTTRTSFDNLGKSIGGFRTASGSAASSALELGRIVSDMPYGIRGVANNMSQFASQMMFSATTVDQATGKIIGLSGAVKNLWASLLGPLGVLLAIQAVIAALDHFEGGNKKAETSSKDLTNVFGEETTKLMVLKNALDSTNVSMESKNELVKNANKEFKDLNVSLDENGKVTEESAKRLDLLSLSFIKNAKARAIAKLIQDEMAKQAEVEARKTGESLAWYETTYYAFKSKIFGFQQVVNQAISKDTENQKEDIKDSADLVKRYVDMLTENDAELAKLFINGGDNKKKDKAKFSPFKTGKELEIDIKSNESAIIDFNKKIEEYKLKGDRDEKLRTAKTAQEKKNINFEYEKKLEEIRIASELDSLKLKKKTEEDVVKGKYETFKIEAELRLKSYNDSIDKNDKISEAVRESLKKKAGLDTAKLIKDAGDEPGGELNKSMGEINEKYKPLFELFEKLKKARLAALVSPPEEQVKEFDKIKHYIGVYKETMSGLTDFISGEYERQLTMEQNKTNSLNEELNNRLLNEKLSKNERESIQKQIWQNDENLRKNQEIIARKKFNTEKAFNISMAIIDTYGGASKALNDKTVPSTIARFALAAATIASGMFQVAKISSQQFQSSSAATPIRGAGIGGSGGQGDRSFNYNLVGNNQANQIAEALQGQFSNPLKAYVVSREVTTQQELDMNIKSGASF